MAPKINLDVVMKLPLQKKIGILAAINVVIVAVIIWALTLPAYNDVSRLKAELKDLTDKLNENRAIAADIPKYQRDKSEMEKRLENAIAQLPNEKEIPDLIDSISASGEKAGLKILLFKPAKEVPKGFYAEIPVTMSVEGRFEGLNDFSVRVGNLPRIVNIGGLDIVSEGHKNRIPVLKANFVTTTFRFIPVSDVPEAKPGAGAKPEAKPAPAKP